MSAHQIIFTASDAMAMLKANRMPVIVFRQALFHGTEGDWRKRLYTASLVVTTVAFDEVGRSLVRDHQAFRFSRLFNDTWPEPVFLRIRNWHYKPVELRRDAPVASWEVEFRLRDLRLGPEERVELVFAG